MQLSERAKVVIHLIRDSGCAAVLVPSGTTSFLPVKPPSVAAGLVAITHEWRCRHRRKRGASVVMVLRVRKKQGWFKP